MLRTALFSAAVLATAALSAPAADPDLSGNWLISYTSRGGASEVNFVIVKIDAKDGKPTASVVAVPPRVTKPTVTEVKLDGKAITVALSNGPAFTGLVGDDAKAIPGSFGNDRTQYRSKMTRTEDDTIESQTTQGNPPAAITKAQSLTTRPLVLRFQASREKDADKKKELLAQLEEAQKEADEKVPALYREVVEKQPTDPVAIDAALTLLQSAAKAKVTPAEATALVGVITKNAAPFGPTYSRFVTLTAAEALVGQKGLEAVAASVLRPVVKGLAASDPAAAQVRVLTAYKTALEKSGGGDELKEIDARLAKLETRLDEEYLATVPPFKPTAYAGRKEKGANRVAVMELFTGAQCPPCVAADVAFDALGKAYRPGELVLIQYHMHIPGPDPLTNPDAIARWDYYRETFPEGIRGTPSTVFNGKPQAGGGGGMPNAERKFDQYREIIDPLLEERTPVKLTGTATRRGDKVEIAVAVDGVEQADDLKLRLVMVEDVVKYVGGNQLRFHHHVVRAMPGGADGVTIKDKTMRHTATADISAVRKDLEKYLDGYAANERPFPSPARPLDMKDLKVIALVQNDKTREILQAVLIEVADKAAGGE